MFRLHCLVLSFFAIAICFHTTSAESLPNTLMDVNFNRTLGFDDIPTASHGFGYVPSPYHHLSFSGLEPFRPLDPAFQGIISPYDYNCAVSKPNSLYGSSEEYEQEVDGKAIRKLVKPRIRVHTRHTGSVIIAPYFTLHSMKVKPLDMPISHATLFFEASRWSCDLEGNVGDRRSLQWNVTFPAGYHDMLHVKLQDFTGQRWDLVESLVIWVEFENGGISMDWEFCIDDIEVEFIPVEDL